MDLASQHSHECAFSLRQQSNWQMVRVCCGNCLHDLSVQAEMQQEPTLSWLCGTDQLTIAPVWQFLASAAEA